jgi:hypothetical protein
MKPDKKTLSATAKAPVHQDKIITINNKDIY